MGFVYRDSPQIGSAPVAWFDGGVVYDKPPRASLEETELEESMPDPDPSSWGAYTIGYYENGAIFRNPPEWGDTPVGYYRDGVIYDNPIVAGAIAIGCCQDGIIYKMTPASRSYPIGYYEGASDGAGATAKLLGLFLENR